MDINQISIKRFKEKYLTTQKSAAPPVQKTYTVRSTNLLMKELSRMSNNNSAFINKMYELNLSTEELQKRTHKDYLITKKMLKTDAPEYLALADGDKQALKHLVKAAYILERINMQLDNPHNLAFKEYLEKEITKVNK